MSGPKDVPIEAVYKEVGGRIARVRQRRRLTQSALGAAAGVSRTTVANIERGEQRFLLHYLFAFADALDIPPSKLLPTEKRSMEERIETVLTEIRTADPEAANMIQLGLAEARKLT